MKKITIIFLLVLALFVVKSAAIAAEVMVFDSTNNYLGGCQLTNKSEWELDKDLNISKFQLWYNWDQNETDLPVTIFYEKEKFAEITATRSACDPYQKQWCNADFAINKLFPKGKYSTQIASAKQCLKPGGTGTVRLYTEEEVNPTEVTPTKEQKPVEIQPTSVVQPSKPAITCSCLKPVGIGILVTFIVTSLLFLLLRKSK
jgi:hypothetical protein